MGKKYQNLLRETPADLYSDSLDAEGKNDGLMEVRYHSKLLDVELEASFFNTPRACNTRSEFAWVNAFSPELA